jgi:OmpR family two-component system bacitracin resistance response regulator BceR
MMYLSTIVTSFSVQTQSFSITINIAILKSVVLRSLFKLLLIEDDESLFQEIKDILTQWSYEVYGVTDFGNVIQEFTAIRPDLVIIDIQLPKFDGFHWCRMIRAHSNVPILFLSSRDHFIQKPFHFEVLIAKIQAILRRVYNYSTEQTTLKTWCQATVDYEKNTVTNNVGSIELTKNEIFILKELIQHKNKIVSRDSLIKSLWDDERFVSDNTLTVNVNRLRKKLEQIELGSFIQTKVGQGYMAVEEGPSYV